MSDIAIRVDGLGKRYAIGAAARQSGQPRRIFDLLESLTGPQWSREETFWALQDVSFEIKHGEIVGVVGGNGAGKSTLLKILSRIVQPTAGCAEIHGRMGSLLEVGTGFHPDLTGRENIFMSGVMLGMRRSEVQRRFDEIVAFSGVERFLDTPIKRYSSGMQTRLGFSVAAYLEAEVLLIDEVLAVGDDEFQKRCLGKMKEVAVGGRTVLFISHNMNSVQALCTRAIWLDKGRLRADSTDVRHVAHEYLSGDVSSARGEWVNTSPDLNEAFIIPLRIRLIDPNGVVVSMPIANNVELTLELDVDVRQLPPGLIIDTSFTRRMDRNCGARVRQMRRGTIGPPCTKVDCD